MLRFVLEGVQYIVVFGLPFIYILHFDFAKHAFCSRLHAFIIYFYYNSLWRKCKFWRSAF